LANPVAIKELRGRMRGRRAFVILTIYLLALAAVVVLTYASGPLSRPTASAADLAGSGRSVFGTILAIQTAAVVLVAPLGLADAVCGERERQTWELLRTTLLSEHAIILGKLGAGLAYVILLLVGAVPMQALAFLLGGISLGQLILTQIVLALTAGTFGFVALYLSTRIRSTQLVATAAMTLCLFLLVATPFAMVMADSLNLGAVTRDAELILAITNPIGALINIMSPAPGHGRALPTLGYALLCAATMNLSYIAIWRRIRYPEPSPA
jgi:ABC-type transport system involved in multi-copper enzyme maturation permease subunit